MHTTCEDISVGPSGLKAEPCPQTYGGRSGSCESAEAGRLGEGMTMENVEGDECESAGWSNSKWTEVKRNARSSRCRSAEFSESKATKMKKSAESGTHTKVPWYARWNEQKKLDDKFAKIDAKLNEPNRGAEGEGDSKSTRAARRVGEHHNPCSGAWLTDSNGVGTAVVGNSLRTCRRDSSLDDPKLDAKLQGKWVELKSETNAMEEITGDANTLGGATFGGAARMIWDSGAGRHICARKHVPGYTLDKSDHPGFSGPSGETIKVDGKTRVNFTDETLGTAVAATFIVADQVNRPILSGGDLNDQGYITISSARGAFVVEEKVAREVCEALIPHAKLSFSRAGPGRLYEHNGNLEPQAALFFQGQEK